MAPVWFNCANVAKAGKFLSQDFSPAQGLPEALIVLGKARLCGDILMADVSPFWTFSLSLYRTPGVPAACIVLQDECGVDVNVLLFALWLANQGRLVGTDDVAEADSAIALWRNEAVRPLRAVRRLLREPPAGMESAAAAALRDKVKAVELEAERLQQEALFALKPAANWGEASDPVAAAARNMDVCAAMLKVVFPDVARQALLGAFESWRRRA